MISYLQIENLTKSFGDLVLLENVALGVAEGQRIGLIAKNGSGKTTLLNIIAGKEGYDSGNISFRRDLRVGYLEQDPQYPENLTVLEACFHHGNSTVELIKEYERCMETEGHPGLDEILIRMDHEKAWDYEQKAKQILSQLKIRNFDQQVKHLSGGQLKRVALANTLITEPDFLILDEPTNHLDLDMTEWLEDYLRRTNLSLLMVTHDRYFLDRVCTEIIEIDNRQIYQYKGNYSYYLEKRQERIDATNVEITRANNLYRTELEWMRRMPQARGHKARYREEAFYELEKVAKQRFNNDNVKLDVKASYIGSKIFEADHVYKSFGDLKILEDFSYIFARYEKMGIVGNNGTGKSTFIKILMGEVKADSGTIDIGETVRFGYYSQDGLQFDEQMKVIDVVQDIAEVIELGNGKKLTASQFLQHFLFTPETQHSYVYKLSGGERRRLYLCTVLMRNPNFLVLDEPTNDLDIITLNVANKIAWNNTGTGASEWGIMSYFGRLSYNYDGKYMVTANVRRDGSSKLHPDHRWGTFPSISAAWRISSEKFMSGLDWLDDMKIRVSWGQTGNQSGVGDYAFLQKYNVTRQEWFKEGNENAVPTITQANLRTSDLTWETTSQTDIGLDLTMFNNRVNLTMDYYYKRTTDMLMYVSLPAGAAAANNIVRNEGEMTNKGFEFSISTQNFRGAFTWNTDFNISFNRNRLEKLELQKIYSGAQLSSDILKEYVVRNEPGRPLGGFYGYISDGVDPQTGELMYRDVNDDGIISALDRTYIGDPNPDFTYGMTNTLSWKNFNLSFFIQGSQGNDVYNASRIETEAMFDGKNQSTRVLKRWKEPGQITDVPKAGFAIKNSSYFVEDGSYLRLKNLTFSYNFTGKLLKRWGVTRLQPYFTANNLLTITGYKGMDPEVNEWGNDGGVQGIDWGSYPHSKSFVFGVNIEF